mgnify:FL=1
MGEVIKIEKKIVGWRVEQEEAGKVQRSKLIVESHAPKRPLELSCDIHKASVKGEMWTIVVGILNGSPYEIMGGLSEYIDIPSKYTNGMLIKRPRKTINARYDLKFGENGDEILLKDVVSIFDNPNHGSLTRMISMSMRHGVPTQYIVEQLQKDKHSDMFSLSRVIARVLKKYISDGTKAGNNYSNCSCEDKEDCNYVYQGGCVSCTTCGFSACG